MEYTNITQRCSVHKGSHSGSLQDVLVVDGAAHGSWAADDMVSWDCGAAAGAPHGSTVGPDVIGFGDHGSTIPGLDS